jgi:hypothetical protein
MWHLFTGFWQAVGRSEQELIECLFRIERDTIGIPCESPERLRPVARRLLDLDVRLRRVQLCAGANSAIGTGWVVLPTLER